MQFKPTLGLMLALGPILACDKISTPTAVCPTPTPTPTPEPVEARVEDAPAPTVELQPLDEAPPQPTLLIHSRERPRILRDPDQDLCTLDDTVDPQVWRCLDRESPLQDDAVIVDMSADFDACRLDLTGRLECQLSNRTSPWIAAEVDEFDLDHMTGVLCVRRYRTIECSSISGPQRAPEVFELLADSVRIGTGPDGVCGLSAAGELRCVDPDEPTSITREIDAVEDFAIGGGHACVIRRQQVECWGESTYGQVGDGGRVARSWSDNLEVTTPSVVAGPSSPQALALGQDFSCALDGDGRVWCWGADDQGQLGRGLETGASSEAQPVWELGVVATIRAWDDSVCALLDDGGLRCWGHIGERWPAALGDVASVASDPRSPPRERYPVNTSCVRRDLSQWARELEAASGTMEVVRMLHELGMTPGIRVPFPSTLALNIDSVELHEVELDGRAQPERVIEVVASAEDHERRMVSFWQAQSGPNGSKDHWCPINLDGYPGLESSLIMDMRPCLEHWSEPEFEGGLDVSFVELSARGKLDVEVRRQDGSCAGYPRSSFYTTEFWSMKDGQLQRIFEPFTTFTESHSVGPEAPWAYGELKLAGGFPRRIETTTQTDWSVDDGDPDDPDADDSRVVTKKRTFRLRGGRYR